MIDLSLERLLAEAEPVGVDPETLRADAAAARRDHAKRELTDGSAVGRLCDRWYRSLAAGAPDYDVYADDAYLADLWACWTIYSRRYLAGVAKLLDEFGRVDRVADLGCGIGFSTARLAELFPDAEVVGTNLAGLRQTAIAERVGASVGFRVVELRDVGHVDLVLASEYFEHFETPVDHLGEVLSLLRPRILLVANTFNGRSTGHFDRYLVDGEHLDGKATGRAFGRYLRERGYEKVPTRLWNQRPTVWRRSDERAG